jgi:hypothetical protein
MTKQALSPPTHALFLKLALSGILSATATIGFFWLEVRGYYLPAEFTLGTAFANGFILLFAMVEWLIRFGVSLVVGIGVGVVALLLMRVKHAFVIPLLAAPSLCIGLFMSLPWLVNWVVAVLVAAVFSGLLYILYNGLLDYPKIPVVWRYIIATIISLGCPILMFGAIV